MIIEIGLAMQATHSNPKVFEHTPLDYLCHHQIVAISSQDSEYIAILTISYHCSNVPKLEEVVIKFFFGYYSINH